MAVAVLEATPEEEIRDFRAWAKEVVRRQALVWLRQQRRSRRQSSGDQELAEVIARTLDEPAGEEAGAGRLDLLALRRCLGQAPERMRRLLLQRYHARATFAQLADGFGGSAGAAQRALSRARLALRDCLRSQLALDAPT